MTNNDMRALMALHSQFTSAGSVNAMLAAQRSVKIAPWTIASITRLANAPWLHAAIADANRPWRINSVVANLNAVNRYIGMATIRPEIPAFSARRFDSARVAKLERRVEELERKLDEKEPAH